MSQNQMQGARSQDSQAGEGRAIAQEFVCQVAAFWATPRDLATRFALPMELVNAGVSSALEDGLIRTESPANDDFSAERRLLRPTPRGYSAAGMVGWKRAMHKPGREFKRKKHEMHRRAVATVAAAKGFLLADDQELLSEIRMRLRGRDEKRKYLFALNVAVGDVSYLHCPDVITLETGVATAATVTEVIAKAMNHEEIYRICNGWSTHPRVSQVEFYAAAEAIDGVWRAIKMARTEAMTKVYLLPDPLDASELLELQPQEEPAFEVSLTGIPTGISVLDETERSQLREILSWVATWDVAGSRAIAGNFKLRAGLFSRLLEYARREELLEAKTIAGEGVVHLLTEAGERFIGRQNDEGLKLSRRSAAYLSRRSHIVAMLTHQRHRYGNEECEAHCFQVINPQSLGQDAPSVDVNSAGSAQSSEADVLLVPSLGSDRPPIVVLVLTHYEPRETLHSLCEAWFLCPKKQVERIVIYAIENVRDELREVIEEGGWGERLSVKTIPPSEYERGEAEREQRRKLQAERNEEMVRERAEARSAFKQGPSPFVEITDREWSVIGPILDVGEFKTRSWNGVEINSDREILNTVLLAERLGKKVKNVMAWSGYGSGPTCAARVREWQEAKVWLTACDKLAELSPERNLSSDPDQPRRYRRESSYRLFAKRGFRRTLEADIPLLEELRRGSDQVVLPNSSQG